jgi:predicted aspartyl protease
VIVFRERPAVRRADERCSNGKKVWRQVNMGKVTEKIRLTSLLDRTKSREVEAVIDTGATLLVLPQDLVEELGLTRIRDVNVRYGNNSVEAKGVYGAVTLELKGRRGIFEALAEAPGSEPLVGQVVLESLDLVVDPRSRTLTPNPLSPEIPMVEIL